MMSDNNKTTFTKSLDFVKSLFSSVINETVNSVNVLQPYQIKDIQEKGKAIYEDFRSLNVSDQTIKDVYYLVISKYSDVPINKEIFTKRLMEETLLNDNFRRQVKQMKTHSSGYISYMKSIIPKYEEMLELMNDNKIVPALKKYKELLDFINIEALDSKLPPVEQEKELNKRGAYPQNTLTYYRARMNAKRYVNEDSLELKTYSHMINASEICNMIQKTLYEIMLSYEQKTKCFYRQMDEHTGLFIIGDTNYITYEFDDDPIPTLEYNGKRMRMEDRIFWSELTSPTFKYSDATIYSSKFKYQMKTHFNSNPIVTPYNHLEETIVRELSKYNDNYDGLQPDLFTEKIVNKLGIKIPTTISSTLLRCGTFYFKDYRYVDALRVYDKYKYETLNKILARNTPEERTKYLNRLRGFLLKERNKPKENNLTPEVYVKSIARLPYKDN